MTKTGIETLHFGRVSDSRQLTVPGDYSTAVSLVVSVSTASSTATWGTHVWWYVRDTLDADDFWAGLEDTRGHIAGRIGWADTTTREWNRYSRRRFIVPFGPTIQVLLVPEIRGSHDPDEPRFLDDVVAKVFWMKAE